MTFGALPGEIVEVTIIRNYKGYSEGGLVRILKPSPDRVEPKCSLFSRCSGCQYQHLAYQEQLAWKRRHAQDALQRIARLDMPDDMVEPTVASPLQYGYRTKMTPHFQEPPPHRQRWPPPPSLQDDAVTLARHGEEDGEGEEAALPIGFLVQSWGSFRDHTGRRWRRVIDVERCPLATDAINAALPTARAAARAAATTAAVTKQRRFVGKQPVPPPPLLLRDTSHDGVVGDGHRVVTEELPGLGPFSFRAGGFFQNNSSILPAFVDHVVSLAAADLPGGHGAPAALLDVFCGVGLFAVSGAARFERVVGIEVDKTAVKLARRNAEVHKVRHAEFLAADAEDGLERLLGATSLSHGHLAVVVDPPRQGLAKAARRALVALRPSRVVYVSCDCATQARDLQDFLAEGYIVKRVTPFDLFPQTRHLEVVVALELS